jgi:hypothetical protein
MSQDLPHTARCSLTGLQQWDTHRDLDEWAGALRCQKWDLRHWDLSSATVKPLASAKYEPSMNVTGWDIFETVIAASGCQDNMIGCQAGAASAGFLEGSLMGPRISDHLWNLLADGGFLKSDESAVDLNAPEWIALEAYEKEQEKWVQSHSRTPGNGVMSVVPYLYAQQAGVAAGLSHAGVELYGLTPWRAAVTINLMGEYSDVLDHLFPSRRIPWLSGNLSMTERIRATLKREHCSAFVALAAYNEDLYVGHNMWWSFFALMPVLKTYTWEALGPPSHAVARRRVQMSSFPGALSSIDDIYSMPAEAQRMVVMETTNPIYNTSLYDLLKPQSLWCWVRVMAANLLSESGAEWVLHFSRTQDPSAMDLNSGTYNNMWMVVDYKRFTRRAPLRPESGVLMIAEQLPGLITSSDETHRLATSKYFASYNQPLLNATRHKSGAAAYDDAMLSSGITPGYQLAGRANLFREYAHLLGSLDGAKQLLRWNKFQTDPVVLSSPDPTHLVSPATYGALASRGDLNPSKSSSTGSRFAPAGPLNSVATNAVLLSASLLNSSALLAQAGPTHDDQPVFSWSTAPAKLAGLPHKGQPDRWDFKWVSLHASVPL